MILTRVARDLNSTHTTTQKIFNENLLIKIGEDSLDRICICVGGGCYDGRCLAIGNICRD
jgi:hypothetical protein